MILERFSALTINGYRETELPKSGENQGGRFLMAVWSEDITKSIEAIRGDFRTVYWDDETFSRLLFFLLQGQRNIAC